MYLSEEKRVEIRACIEKQRSYSKKDKPSHITGLKDSEDIRKIPQILFDSSDGKEVFTPF